MGMLGGLLFGCLIAVATSPRQFGRFLAKIRIGYRAQLRDEGEI